MVYIILLSDCVYGVYETIDLVRLNLMIIFFFNMERGNIELEKYENLLEYLKSDSFSENTFHIPDFKGNMVTSSGEKFNLQVEIFDNEKNGSCPLKYILNHINWRFIELEKKMEHDVRIKVTVPGENSHNHALGEPYSNDWKWVDNKNWEKLKNTLHEYISFKLKSLEAKFKDRVQYGEVLYQNATGLNYQLWSANGVNWDLPEGDEIPGKYQAAEMKFQGPGVYGIVVTPLYGYHNLVPEEYEE
jgi:hypothetical protein